MKRLSILFCTILFFSWELSYSQYKVNPEAKKFLDSAAKLGRTEYTVKLIRNMRITADSLYKIKINLVNRAIRIDTNYFGAYWYKFLFQDQIKDDRGALKTIKKALQLRPDMAIIKYKIGLAYDRVGDSVPARPYYQSFLSSCDSVLDTMSVNNKKRYSIEIDKVNVLTLLGEPKKGHDLLINLYKKEANPGLKELYEFAVEHMNMARGLIIKNRDIIKWGNFNENETKY